MTVAELIEKPEPEEEIHVFEWSATDLTDLCGHVLSDGEICGQHRYSPIHGWKPHGQVTP